MWFKRKQEKEVEISEEEKQQILKSKEIAEGILDEIEEIINSTPEYKKISLGADLIIETVNHFNWYKNIIFGKQSINIICESFCSQKEYENEIKKYSDLQKNYRPQWLFYLIKQHNEKAEAVRKIFKEKILDAEIEKYIKENNENN